MEKEKKSGGLRIKSALIGGGIGIVFTCILWLICAVLLYNSVIPPAFICVSSYVSLGIGGILGAIVGSVGGCKRLYSALISCGIILIFFMLTGIFFKNAVFSIISFTIVLIILLISAIIGSVLSTLIK